MKISIAVLKYLPVTDFNETVCHTKKIHQPQTQPTRTVTRKMRLPKFLLERTQTIS